MESAALTASVPGKAVFVFIAQPKGAIVNKIFALPVITT